MTDKTIMKRAQQELRDAYDFDPKDPMFGLVRDDIRGEKISRRATLRLLAAGGALTMAQVLPGLRPSAAFADGHGGGVLRAAWGGVSEITTLDPAQIGQVLQFQITSNVLSGLMHINNSLVAEGDLAESWDVSEDGLVYTIKLREGVTFHNGDAFDAEDVLFTFARSSDPEQSRHSRVIGNVANLEALSSHEVRFTLKKPQASFLTKALERASGRAMTIVSRGGLEQLGLAQYGLTPVGTGPFKITEHELGSRVVLEKNENYWDPERPKLDGVIITPVDGTEPLAAAIEAGDVQYIGGNPLPGELVDRPIDELKTEKGFMVRLALAKALDRDLFVKQAMFGNGVPAYGSINAAMGFYYDESIAETSEQAFDPDGAKALLAAAGYPGGAGFPTIKLQTTPNTRRAGLVVANIYKQVLGITVEVDPKEFSVGIDEFQKMDFDLRLGGSGGDYDPDDGLVDWMQTASKFNGPTRNVDEMPFGFYSEAESDAAADEQSLTADPEARRALVQKANQITSDKVACGFLYHPVDILVHSTSVNVPPESRIPGLHDFDRMTLS